MAKALPVALYVVVMIAVVVGVDLLVFRHRFEARLIANIVIVAAFAGAWFAFLRKP